MINIFILKIFNLFQKQKDSFEKFNFFTERISKKLNLSKTQKIYVKKIKDYYSW